MPVPRRFVPAAQWKDTRHRRGLRGERLALAYLSSCGWQLEAHRFRWGRHDLDLVMRRGHIVAFVEVKTRRGSTFGAPVEAITRRKQTILARVASGWRLGRGRPGDVYRFDVVSVVERADGEATVEHLPDAWRMGG